jgi:hypothetical protein
MKPGKLARIVEIRVLVPGAGAECGSGRGRTAGVGAELEDQRPFDGGPLGFMALTSGFEAAGSGRFVRPWAEISRSVPGL